MEAESYHVDKSRWYPSYWTKRQFSQSIDLPKTLKENHQKLTRFLEQQLNKLGNRPFVIMGDMNLGDLAEQEFDPKLVPVGAETDNGIQVQTFDRSAHSAGPA